MTSRASPTSLHPPRPRPCTQVNLIEYNETPGAPFVPSSPEAVRRFRDVLIRGGRVCTVRSSRGDDEMAACGQLGDPGLSWKPAPVLQPPEPLRLAMERAREDHLRAKQQLLLQQQEQEEAACQ